MKDHIKISLLVLLSLIVFIGVTMLPPMPQNPSFHLFADGRTMATIPNFLNVISNLPFVIIGIYGLSLLRIPAAQKSIILTYAVLFSGIVLTGFGSAYYHYSPNNDTLVF